MVVCSFYCCRVCSEFIYSSRRFHEIIYDGSRNEVLARQLRAMRARMRHPQASMFDRPGRIRHSLAEHQGVLQAVLAGDEDAACRLMTGHISSGGNVYADAIATMSEPIASSVGSAVTSIEGVPRRTKKQP